MEAYFVIDDERNICDLIKKYLVKEGYLVTLFNDAGSAYEEIKRLKPDLIVLDIMMAGMTGLELCQKIRIDNEVPIIFVSARDEELDRILGLELGGDDYLTKPFSPRELTVRIKNIFKRLEKNQSIRQQSMVLDDLHIYPSRRYIEKEGEELKFTAKEYEVLEFMAKNKNQPFTREQLIQKIWGYDYIGEERIIDDIIKRIRKKLSTANSNVKIVTVWGYGYRIDG
ncbi:MAG: response regulator transcription factor [Clostridia bacterium]|nr:response regulator transcription factor [Clostridia bacterium]